MYENAIIVPNVGESRSDLDQTIMLSIGNPFHMETADFVNREFCRMFGSPLLVSAEGHPLRHTQKSPALGVGRNSSVAKVFRVKPRSKDNPNAKEEI